MVKVYSPEQKFLDNKELVHHVANKFSKPGRVWYDDCISTAAVRLWVLCQKHTAMDAREFVTVASSSMKFAIIDFLRKNADKRCVSKVRKAVNEYIQQASSPVSVEEAINALYPTNKRNVARNNYYYHVDSFNEPICTRNDGKMDVFLGDVIPDENVDIVAAANASDNDLTLRRYLSILSDNYRYIVTQYCLNGVEVETLAKEFGVTNARIWQMVNIAIRKMTAKAQSEKLQNKV